MCPQVAGALKEDGTLGKIQAELRAAVYFAMEAANTGNTSTEPSPLGKFEKMRQSFERERESSGSALLANQFVCRSRRVCSHVLANTHSPPPPFSYYFFLSSVHPGLRSFALTNDGRFTIELVREFLAYFDLSCTDNVLVSEAGQQNAMPINRGGLGEALAVVCSVFCSCLAFVRGAWRVARV